RDREQAIGRIRALHAHARAGRRVEVACGGGVGAPRPSVARAPRGAHCRFFAFFAPRVAEPCARPGLGPHSVSAFGPRGPWPKNTDAVPLAVTPAPAGADSAMTPPATTPATTAATVRRSAPALPGDRDVAPLSRGFTRTRPSSEKSSF
ncbi:hypothetical protein AB0J07_33875, partial [Microbispora rosea]